MNKERMVAFSDGVFAVIITIMVLDLKAPETPTLAALRGVLAPFAAYVLSFLYVAIYWNNHHHLLQITRHINGRVMWANMNLLFWASLIPFTTRWLDSAWLSDVHHPEIPVVLYGLSLLFTALSYFLLQNMLVRLHGKDSALGRAFARDFKGPASLVLYIVAIASALWNPAISLVIYLVVATLWFIPDRRIEGVLGEAEHGN